MPRSRLALRRPLSSFGTIALAATLLLSGCGSATDPTSELRAARTRWQRTHPANYAYTLARSCECVPGTSGPARIEVRDDVVQSRTYTYDGAAVDPKFADAFPTMDGLFAIIEEAAAHGQSVDATYDARYGYPRRIAIDREHWEVDGGANLTIRDFQPLP